MKNKTDPKAMNVDQLYQDIFDKGYMKDEIQCDTCHKSYLKNSEDFISVYGNIMVGLKGGIVGNNFDEDGRLFRIAYFCRDLACIPEAIYKLDWILVRDALMIHNKIFKKKGN